MNGNKKVEELSQMREDAISEQGALFSQIIADSKNPELTAALLCRVTDNAVRHHQLTQAHADAIEKASHLPAWLRTFIP